MLLYLGRMNKFVHINLKLIHYFRITQRELVIVSHSHFVIFGYFKNEPIEQSKLSKQINLFNCSLNQHSANVGAALAMPAHHLANTTIYMIY